MSGVRIEIRNVTKKFNLTGTKEGILLALDDVSLTMEEGHLTVIGGANGSGKSVLMSICKGLSKPTSGTVSITEDGKPSGIGLVFQEADTQILGETPLEDAMTGPLNMGFSKAQAKEKALQALEKVGLSKKLNHPSRFLSGGEKRRLTTAGCLAMDVRGIIFDEPYANLDYDGVKQVNNLVKGLLSEGKTVVILTHELEKCLGLAHSVKILFKGKKVFDGTPEEFLEQDTEIWSIHNPMKTPSSLKDLVWL